MNPVLRRRKWHRDEPGLNRPEESDDVAEALRRNDGGPIAG